MAFTRHGHQITGTPAEKRPADMLVARCGGEGMCDQCRSDAAFTRQETRTLDDILRDAVEHERANPWHGYNCNHMDDLVMEARKAIKGLVPGGGAEQRAVMESAFVYSGSPVTGMVAERRPRMMGAGDGGVQEQEPQEEPRGARSTLQGGQDGDCRYPGGLRPGPPGWNRSLGALVGMVS